MHFVAVALLLIWQAKAQEFPVDKCFDKDVGAIPKCHIYHKKCKPLVLGHRGNPKKIQENTLDGFQSVLEDGADGFEVDVFLSKDKQVVCFHDDNAERLTGVNRNIHDMNAAEIQQLRYKTTIAYGAQTYTYDKPRKIPFLHEVLIWAKNTNLLVYIEMKPATLIHTTPEDLQRATELAGHVAYLVNHFQMQKQVLINSFDITKSLVVKNIDNKLVIGNSYTPAYWYQPPQVYAALKASLQQLPGLQTCLADIPTTDNRFVDFFYQSGTVEKAMNATFVDIDQVMFNDPTYGGIDQTVKTLKKNYGKKVVIGAYTIYDMHLSGAQIEAVEGRYKMLLRQGVHIFYTDDIVKLRCLGYRTGGRHRRCLNRRCRSYPRSHHPECNFNSCFAEEDAEYASI
ncbi:uncharacterized protein LOC135695518 [Rhopilema esculentum]|uniref:uncharacterized protein LOC135695518 n=1 Tax=Rhopilema esculentum TaxID=499914 RepID=UPI0031D56225